VANPDPSSRGKFCKACRNLFPKTSGRFTLSRQNRAFPLVAYPVLSKPQMNVSLYQAAAAMNAQARWQELIAENLAASSVPGYRKQEISFSSVAAGLTGAANGATDSRFVIPAASSHLNFKQGPLRATNASLDLALEGGGMFEVQMPNGTRAYTRDGEFQLNAQGQLVTKQGYLVQGDAGPLQFDPNNGGNITISPTGDVTQGGEIRGRIRLVEFSDPQLLTPIGQGCFLANVPEAKPEAARATSVRQGFLEAANTSPTAEMASLITAMRMFEANQRVLQVQDERMGRVITELGGPT
jgi:flagellar basal-body rod protein FlgG